MNKKIKKFLITILIVLAMGLIFKFFKEEIVLLIQKVPWLWNLVTYFAGEIGTQSLLGLFYLAMLGSLFFIFLPVEATFFIYLSSDHPYFLLIPIVIVGSVIGLTIDYLIGYGVSIFKKSAEQQDPKLFKIRWRGAILLAVEDKS